MQRWIVCGLGLLLTTVLWHGTATAAVGLGPYLELGGGGGRAEWDSDYDDWEITATSGAIGFALDSSPIGPQRFAYRLNVGLAAFNLIDEDGDKFFRYERAFDDVEVPVAGIAFENYFTFAAVNRPHLRWWVGPTVGLGFYGGESDRYLLDSGASGEIKANLAAFDFGAATGLNLLLGRNLVLAPTAGVRWVVLGGTGERKYYNDPVFGTFTAKEDFSAWLSMGYVNLSLLF